MEYIRVKGVDTKDIARIVLNEGRITVETRDNDTAAFLRELINKWRKNYSYLKDPAIFEGIPGLTSHYSRLFFSDIIKE